ncbi:MULTISPECIES: hypothetical protein [Tenacibaculum]|nr:MULTISPECIES: hypothetical protein [Tenacibaculum]MDO6599505.1 hypothetical protein [Tenacibaculum sp. 1_MG-2023]
MEFKRKFGKKKQAKPQKGLFLVVLLAIALYLFFNADSLLSKFF